MNYNFIHNFYRLHLLPLLLFLLVPFFSLSQSWADNNAVWHYTKINYGPPNQEYIRFTAAGDTLINGDTLKIILEEIISLNDTLSGEIYMKSDSNRVYYYIPEIEAYKLLYDFNANPGDTIEVYCRQAFNDSTLTIHVDSISTIDVNGNILKVQHVSQVHSPTDEFWLEGEIIENIGWKGFMFPLHAWADPPYGGSLRCYQDDIIGNFKLTDVQCNYIANSQQNTYQNLVQEGKIWSNTSIPSMPGEYRSYWIKFEGDTIINGLEYKKALRADDSMHSEWNVKGFIREDVANQKVYLYNNFRQEDLLLYDFSLEQGDSILTWAGYSAYVKVDTVLYEPFGNSTDTLKQICFFSSCSWKWIEGIGSLSGILEGLNAFYLVGGTPKLVCYYENNNLIYHNPDFETCFPEGIVSAALYDNKENFEIFPNPARDKITIYSQNSTILAVEMYDLTGTCVYRNLNAGSNRIELETGKLPKGMYVLKVRDKRDKISRKILIQ